MAKYAALIGNSTYFRNASGGGNSGNMVHALAAQRILRDWRTQGCNAPWDDAVIERLRAEASHIVVIAANGVKLGMPENTFGKSQILMAQNIEAAGLPVVVLGLGSQSQKGDVPPNPVIAPETQHFLEVVSAHSQKVAVRGEFTAEVLDNLGIKNTEVLGCQSCFMSCDTDFADKIEVPESISSDKVVANYTWLPREKLFLDYLLREQIDVIGQESFYEWHLRFGEGDNPFAESPGVKRAVRAMAELDRPFDEFVAYVKQHFRQYEDVEHWIKDMPRYRLAVGTRFHGNMAALQAGVPALWISHDSRTRELCGHLGLPYMHRMDLMQGMTSEDFLARCDYGEFRKRYRGNYMKMKAYLDAAGLDNRL